MDTGQGMILSSSMTLTTRKTKYSMNIMKPNSLLMRHLHAAMEMMTKSSMRKSSTMAQKRPLELTWTGMKPLTEDHSNHGNGSLKYTHEMISITKLWIKYKHHVIRLFHISQVGGQMQKLYVRVK
ncbi:hypothetical protein NL108_005361 [Boleophthalmus pectinirostris]|nr:hypothetical protein NL108_005361 [Boleophthalmus pectinirostris]